jgi:hypothetical protein
MLICYFIVRLRVRLRIRLRRVVLWLWSRMLG